MTPTIKALPRIGALVHIDPEGKAVVYMEPHGKVVLDYLGVEPEMRSKLEGALNKITAPQTVAQSLAAAILLGDEEVAARALADYLQENGFHGA